MKIAIASGKGGTGKTLVAVNLAQVIPDAFYVDCDVEEPNGHIFLKPQIQQNQDVFISIPYINESACTLCGKCMEVCQYHAILAGKKVIVFPELCHGCGSCVRQCPAKAITEMPRVIGAISSGNTAQIHFLQGLLNIGEPMSPPVIRELKKQIPLASIAVLDSPPGTSCPMVTTVKYVDFVILVTEPTPFGLHDLALAVETLKKLNTTYYGVVINKSGSGDTQIEAYCKENNIEILAKIPHSLEIAKLYAQGKMLADLPEYHSCFSDIYYKIIGELS